MFKRENRFSFRRKIPKKIFSNSIFNIRYEIDGNNNFSVAVVVGKKVDSKAVARNKIKRMIVKHLKSILPMDSKSTLVIFAKKPIVTMNEEDLKLEIESSLKKIKVI